ncbi:MAG TPA: energy-coupled thiamine transporter ThiT [Candidatus Ozemobacteraceae bacterium]|nr:energy-coupled thiamine transporter ThiT [Candidatus Ozemobacteraceae bacterium]
MNPRFEPTPAQGLPSRLQQTAETGLLIALSLALSQFRLFELPAGGSLSLGGLPLLLLAARRGVKRGVAAGLLAGLLLTLRRPFIVHPVQFLLDYPLAHGALGLAGILRWKSPGNAATAVTFACSLRLLCHVTAGVVFFSDPASDLSAAIVTSSIYNLGHMIPETVVSAGLAAWLAARHPELTRAAGTTGEA